MSTPRRRRSLALLLALLALLGAHGGHLLAHGPGAGTGAPTGEFAQLHNPGCEHGVPASGHADGCLACHMGGRPCVQAERDDLVRAAVPADEGTLLWTPPTLTPASVVDRHLARGPPVVA